MFLDIVRVTKSFTFDMAHALHGYDGPCKNIHGHTYKLWVTLQGHPLHQTGHHRDGMVIDFSDLKTAVNIQVIEIFDHALVLNEHSPHKNIEKNLREQFEKIIYLPIQPTCEMMMLHFKNLLIPFFVEQELVYIKLEETPTSYAEWFKSDNI